MSNLSQYRSGFEIGIVKNLEKRGVRFEYESMRISYWKKIPSCRCQKCGSTEVGLMHTYTPDFILPEYGLIIEAKGKLDSRTRTKMLAVQVSNPELEVRFLFMVDNWLTKKHRERYSDWCIKHGFKFAFKEIPDGWLEHKE